VLVYHTLGIVRQFSSRSKMEMNTIQNKQNELLLFYRVIATQI